MLINVYSNNKNYKVQYYENGRMITERTALENRTKVCLPFCRNVSVRVTTSDGTAMTYYYRLCRSVCNDTVLNASFIFNRSNLNAFTLFDRTYNLPVPQATLRFSA